MSDKKLNYFLILSLTLIIFLFALIGCISSPPGVDEVKAQFNEKNKDYSVHTVIITEQEAGAYIYTITYSKPNDSLIYSQGWQYLDKGDSIWVLSNTSMEEVISPGF